MEKDGQPHTAGERRNNTKARDEGGAEGKPESKNQGATKREAPRPKARGAGTTQKPEPKGVREGGKWKIYEKGQASEKRRGPGHPGLLFWTLISEDASVLLLCL